MLKKLIPKPLRKKLHQLKMERDQQRFTPYSIHREFYGRDCEIYIADPMAKAWYDGPPSGSQEEAIEIALLRRRSLKTGARVFDLGAHQCVVALKLAVLVGESGRVIAVEANPHNARVGQKNQELNQIHQLTVVPAAVAAKAGELQFSDSWGDQQVGSGTVKVPAVTIDSLTQKYGPPDVIYLDVEGFECEALQGATQTLKGYPDFYIEVHAGIGLEEFGGSVETLLSYLPTARYELLAVQPSEGDRKEEAVPFHKGLPWLDKRFYLIGLSKD